MTATADGWNDRCALVEHTVDRIMSRPPELRRDELVWILSRTANNVQLLEQAFSAVEDPS